MTAASVVDVLEDVEAQTGSRLWLTSVAKGIPHPPLGYEDAALPLKLAGDRLAIRVPEPAGDAFYRRSAAGRLEVAVPRPAGGGHEVGPGSPTILRDAVRSGEVEPVLVEETPFSREGDDGGV